MTFTTLERLLCCAVVDSDEIVTNLRIIRSNPDELAVSMVAYTHDPIVKHVTDMFSTALVLDNNEVRYCDEDMGYVSATNNKVVSTALDATTTSPVVEKAVEELLVESSTVPDIMVGDVPCPVAAGESPVNMEAAQEACPAGVDAPIVKVVIPTDKPSSVYRPCQDVVEVVNHRRLPHHKQGCYAASVVSEIKNRLGCPKITEANRLAVRRMAHNIMAKHGLRPSTIRKVIERVIAGVFVPDEEDLLAAKMMASVGVKEMRHEMNDAAPKTIWSEFANKIWHPFKNRGAERVRGHV